MTRINAGIAPHLLPNKLLMAEHREIKRIANQVSNGKYVLKDIPEEFKLGSGHVKFFYNKGKYTFKRYMDIYNECKKRGLNVTYFGDAWNSYPTELYNDWEETNEAKELITDRIRERGFEI